MTPGPTFERFFVRYQCRTDTRTAYVAARTQLEALLVAYEVLNVPAGREDDVTIYPAPWQEDHGPQV